jgi:hypothetical protein
MMIISKVPVIDARNVTCFQNINVFVLINTHWKNLRKFEIVQATTSISEPRDIMTIN